jgi:hypothetical protein
VLFVSDVLFVSEVLFVSDCPVTSLLLPAGERSRCCDGKPRQAGVN